MRLPHLYFTSMKKLFLLLLLITGSGIVMAQTNLVITVTNEGKENLVGASVSINNINQPAVTDSSGIATFKNISAGIYTITVSHIGFESVAKKFTVIANTNNVLVIDLEHDHDEEEEEEIIVRSTRTSRNIQNVPTRIEVISMEEIDEKSNMRPANISMLLHESTGIQVQQTSATSANASIRIQGLDGRYTQLLKDGFAGYGNFASGLSVLEIPPLDLQQVEIIKGPASTLYGGGAIAGVVNFISKQPKMTGENSFLLNQSNIGQTNIGFFSAKRNKKIGYSFLGLYNYQKLYDVDKDDFTEVPKGNEFIIHPRLFLYPDSNTVINIGNSFTWGKREGGDVQVLKGRADANHTYYEQNNTWRNSTTIDLTKKINSSLELTAKSGFFVFNRHIEIPNYHFDGINYNSFTDVSLLKHANKHELVTGLNVVYDKFNELKTSVADRDNYSLTSGVYVQDTWDALNWLQLESGVRVDYARFGNTLFKDNNVFVLPRLSAMFRLTDKITSRVGGGWGYKLPTLFTERTEMFQYENLLQLNNVKAERSMGSTADINYKTKLGSDFDFSLNQLFFYTRINKPMVLENDGGGNVFFVNSSRPVVSSGFETNAKFIFKHDYKLFLGYTFTDVYARYLTGNQFMPLVPKHKFNSALIYEKHGFLKVGLEGYYTSPQYLFNGFRTQDFWEFGFMVEKIFRKFSVYINFENFTDTRQGRFKNVVNGPHQNPSFDDIWTHTEGFVLNGGIKIKL